jgi:acyl-coenzyme A thioesterase PaaI-like protein
VLLQLLVAKVNAQLLKAVVCKDLKPKDVQHANDADAVARRARVALTEALAQAMGVMVLVRPEHKGKLGYFASINNVRFRELVRPGDELRLEAVHVKEKTRFYIAQARATVNDKLACEAELMLFLAE